jgi:hypothetical protein
MPGGIGSLVQDADDLDCIAQDPIVEDVVFDATNTTAWKEPWHAGADFWEVGQ